MKIRLFFKKKTFTLIEMLIVIVIIGILASALVPRLLGIQERAYNAGLVIGGRDFDNSMKIKESDMMSSAMGERDFDGNGYDGSINRNNLTITYPGSGFGIDTNMGTTQYLMGYNPNTRAQQSTTLKNNAVDTMCISGLFRINHATGSANLVRSARYTLLHNAQNLTLSIGTIQTSSATLSNLGVSINKRFHFALQFDGTGTTYRVNGVKKYQNLVMSSADSPLIGADVLFILQYDSVNTPDFMKNLRIWPFPCNTETLK